MGVVTEPKEDPAIEELKEIKAHEETNNVTLHAPLLREEPEEDSSSDEEEKSKEEQIARYLAILRKLKANSSYTEALEEEDKPVVLAKECNALVQKKLPQKMPDPGSFLILCTIRTISFEKALCDLGSGINLMPLSVMKRLEILEVQCAIISLEMADKTLKRSYGMVEDVLVKVDDLYIPVEFVILDTGDDRNESIILGRPFLAIAKAIIDVERGDLVLRLHEDCILFKIPNPQSSADRESTIVQHIVSQPSLSVESFTEPPDTNSKFGVGQPSSSTGKKVSKILSLEHVELIHESTGRKFTVRGKDLST
ncbi:uncharacterized protein LOC107470305 [Arachis duranensis]|uniref:Uncharacterized protein LOC107470305 n=1 Tax=Arachis duranensis TaxID=130453 RepID=A0A6P4C6D9_ARADU|nr:uncharacterized protein LOC107470305 [Arachis duranensis]